MFLQGVSDGGNPRWEKEICRVFAIASLYPPPGSPHELENKAVSSKEFVGFLNKGGPFAIEEWAAVRLGKVWPE